MPLKQKLNPNVMFKKKKILSKFDDFIQEK